MFAESGVSHVPGRGVDWRSSKLVIRVPLLRYN